MNCFGLMRRREMKKIKDERLLLKNLKNIRIAFLVQSIGLFSVLTYIALTEGPREATGNLFFTVFILSMVVYLWLTLDISRDVSDHNEIEKRPAPYYRWVLLSAGVGIAIGHATRFGPDKSSVSDSLLVAGVVFVCFLILYSINYFIKKKRYNEDND